MDICCKGSEILTNEFPYGIMIGFFIRINSIKGIFDSASVYIFL